MAEKNKKVIKYKSPIKLNLGIVIFGLIFIYLFINIVIYFTTERTTYYEVVLGSNAELVNSSYRGIALRDEDIAYAQSNGYIDYFVHETSRISKNTTLYSIDAEGNMTDLLTNLDSEDYDLSDKDLDTLKELLNDYSNNHNDMDYSSIYSFKNMLKGTLIDLVNMNSLEELANESGRSFSINKSILTGIVVYGVDNYETITQKDLSPYLFDESSYTYAKFTNGEQVEEGTPIYKTINDEEWSIAVQLSPEQAEIYKDKTGVKIRFKKDNQETTANMEVVQDIEGNNYGIISLSKYVVRYATERFIDIEILDDITYGFKIPKSSLAKKQLYTIPKKFGEEGGVSKDIAFNKRIEVEGEIQNEFYYPQITYSDEYNYYVSTSLFKAGDILIGMDTNETYVIGNTQDFVGVYNINNGYTVFVRVNILVEMDEYYIVESGDVYGLELYDRIVLDSSSVDENQIIFQ